MLKNYEPDWNIEDLTDAEIYAAIRYLEPDPICVEQNDEQNNDEQNDDNRVAICFCLYIVLLGCLAFVWFYWR